MNSRRRIAFSKAQVHANHGVATDRLQQGILIREIGGKDQFCEAASWRAAHEGKGMERTATREKGRSL
jgi:hypothetical protein